MTADAHMKSDYCGIPRLPTVDIFLEYSTSLGLTKFGTNSADEAGKIMLGTDADRSEGP
jgi:hypothetical protein